jgi:LPXTG-motif cell wall-anchored protein
MTRISIILVAAVCALALPAAALAQSAGDNQYQDPLAAPQSRGNSGSGGGSGSGSGSSTPAPSQGSSSGSGSGTAGSPGSSGSTGSGTASTSGLPRTGGHPELLALLGVALLGGGLGLRRRLETR